MQGLRKKEKKLTDTDHSVGVAVGEGTRWGDGGGCGGDMVTEGDLTWVRTQCGAGWRGVQL